MKKTYNNSQMTVFDNGVNKKGKLLYSPEIGGDCTVEINQSVVNVVVDGVSARLEVGQGSIRYTHTTSKGKKVVYVGEYREGAFRLNATEGNEDGGVAVLCRASDNLLVGTWCVGKERGLWQIELRE